MKGAKIAALLVALCLSHGAFAQGRQFDLSAMDAVHGIPEFARQAGIQIVAPADDLGGISTPAIRGNFDVRVALKKLLVGTDLDVASDDGAVITLRRRARTTRSSGDRAGSHPQQPISAAGAAASSELEEILVTAEKKTERLQEVPVPVSVISAQAIMNGPLRIQDYYNQVPGLNMTPGPQDQNTLSIRGISTGQGSNRTVGVLVDDVPFGADINYAGGAVIPDIDPNDLERIEVLRGPQGTLYGASSMGGLIKFVTIDPSTDGVSGRVQAGTSTVYNGAELGYNFRASLNVPLSDTVAMRFSAFTRQDPGYIDNPVLGIDGVNEDHVSGGRLATLWKPSDLFSLKFSALYQNYERNGNDEVDLPNPGPPATFGLGELQQNYGRGVGISDRKLQAYSLTINATLGPINLVSISGYNNSHSTDTIEQGYAYAPDTEKFFNGDPDSLTFANWAIRRFSQEVRLSASLGGKFDWLVGAFYTYESAAGLYQNTEAYNYFTGQLLGQAWDIPFPSTFTEYAAFADVTYHFTDRFDIQIGGRESQNRQTLSEAFYGPFNQVPGFLTASGVSGPYIEPNLDSKDNSFTYLITPRLKLSPDLMLYARVASGYRPGGPNLNGVSSSYSPDKTDNYELGLKGDFIDHSLSVDASLYYIDWKNIQIQLVEPVSLLNYLSNGSGAKSEGVELSVTSRPISGLTLGGWVALNNAVLTKDFPPTAPIVETSGTRLPEAAKFTGNLSIDQEFTIASGTTASVGATGIYVGNRYGVFSVPPRYYYPGYAQLNARAGVKHDSWRFDAYVYNATDRRGVLSGGLEASVPYAVIVTQPRTIGLNISRAF